MSLARRLSPAGIPSTIATSRGPCDSPEVIQRSRLIRGASVAFDKYEGLGNDFVVIDASRADAVDAETARSICDRRFGVGADGVLLVLPPNDEKNVARMRVVNADGSIPEMCGNGLRCVALHVARSGKNADGAYETDAGLRGCTVDESGDEPFVTVDMGLVRSVAPRGIDLGNGEMLEVRVGDAGNPHAILFGDFDDAAIRHIGPKVAVHAAFPEGTNVEFARIRGNEIDLVVWERGVGLTLACGTGACATVAVACDNGLLEWATPTLVHLPGGTLEITVTKDGGCKMRGPAHHVFSGILG
ncbi:MAG TPA: diaminopimelate epimerase [Polyangiaceae bacterium]